VRIMNLVDAYSIWSTYWPCFFGNLFGIQTPVDSRFFPYVFSSRSFPQAHRSLPHCSPPHCSLPQRSFCHCPFPLTVWFIMAKSTKLKASKSPKRSRTAELSHTESKKPGRPRRRTAAALASEAVRSEASDDEADEPTTTTTTTLKTPARVVWDKYPERTERLLDYLDAHSDVAIKLFGDSTQVAKLEGRTKMTAKSNKGAAYLQVAAGVFSVDDDAAVRADFATNPNKYAKAVDNYITNT
jgi:hypothetical protein